LSRVRAAAASTHRWGGLLSSPRAAEALHDRGDTMIKGNVSKDTLGKIIDRLASDDDFRARLTASPKATLAEYGLEVDESRLPSQPKLASKEEIAATRDDLHQKVQGNLGLIMFIA
jgi:putative modified peptide